MANAPPATPSDGDCWLVGTAPTGEWSGHAGAIACRQAGAWLFVTPRDGMRMLDKAAGQDIRYAGGAWLRAAAIGVPTGGTTADSEARTAIAALIGALVVAGIVPAS